MSLIKCPECKKEISDKAEICIACGYPIAKYIKKNENLNAQNNISSHSIHEINILLDELYLSEGGKKILIIKKFSEKINCTLDEARKIVNDYWGKRFPEKELHYTPQGEIPEKTCEISENKLKCPYCSGKDLLLIENKKKFSVSKSLIGNTVGGIIGGPVGAIVGAFAGVNGKDGKTKFVCQKCGKVFEKKI